MSYVAEAARDTLRAAGVNLRQARRALLLAAGVLALLHLLTVGPYIAASKRLAEIEQLMSANQTLLAAVDPGVASLADAGAQAQERLEIALLTATDAMIGDFQALRGLVANAQDGQVPPLAQPAQHWPIPQEMQQMQQLPQALEEPPAQIELPAQGLPPAQINAPALQLPPALPQPQMQQQQVDLGNIPTLAWTDIPQQQMQQQQQMQPQDARRDTRNAPNFTALDRAPGSTIDPELHAVLTAIAEGRRDAYPMMTAYGRDRIVKPAYEQAQQAWDRDIRPVYLHTLAALIKNARVAAANAPAEVADTAAQLSVAADRLVERQKAIAALELRHDTMVDQSLDSDWWFTVQGKTAYADAVIRSIHLQLESALGVASAASDEVKQVLALQTQLQNGIAATQERLRQQFTAQRDQLTALSGFGGVLPVDLASFIGLFPLVLGLVLGLLLLRAAEERRQAGQSASDLAAISDGDSAARQWLIRQALGARTWRLPAASTLVIALAGTAWVWFTAAQVQGIEPPPVLASQTSALAGTAVILLAALWDLAAIRRLARAQTSTENPA